MLFSFQGEAVKEISNLQGREGLRASSRSLEHRLLAFRTHDYLVQDQDSVCLQLILEASRSWSLHMDFYVG